MENNEDVISLGNQSKSSELTRKPSNVFLNHNQSGGIREFIIISNLLIRF